MRDRETAHVKVLKDCGDARSPSQCPKLRIEACVFKTRIRERRKEQYYDSSWN